MSESQPRPSDSEPTTAPIPETVQQQLAKATSELARLEKLDQALAELENDLDKAKAAAAAPVGSSPFPFDEPLQPGRVMVRVGDAPISSSSQASGTATKTGLTADGRRRVETPEGVWEEKSVSDAREMLKRRREELSSGVAKVRSALVASLAESLAQGKGPGGENIFGPGVKPDGHLVLNDNNELVNEEGLPFFEPIEQVPDDAPESTRRPGYTLPFERSMPKGRSGAAVTTKEERMRWLDRLFADLEEGEEEEEDTDDGTFDPEKAFSTDARARPRRTAEIPDDEDEGENGEEDDSMDVDQALPAPPTRSTPAMPTPPPALKKLPSSVSSTSNRNTAAPAPPSSSSQGKANRKKSVGFAVPPGEAAGDEVETHEKGGEGTAGRKKGVRFAAEATAINSQEDSEDDNEEEAAAIVALLSGQGPQTGQRAAPTPSQVSEATGGAKGPQRRQVMKPGIVERPLKPASERGPLLPHARPSSKFRAKLEARGWKPPSEEQLTASARAEQGKDSEESSEEEGEDRPAKGTRVEDVPPVPPVPLNAGAPHMIDQAKQVANDLAEEEEEEDDSDDIDLSFDEASDVNDEEGIDLDEAMHQREVALEYHRRRHQLAEGAGTGSLSGEELARLLETSRNEDPWEQEFVPLDATTAPRTDFEKRGKVSRFRASRFAANVHGQMRREDPSSSSSTFANENAPGLRNFPPDEEHEHREDSGMTTIEQLLSDPSVTGQPMMVIPSLGDVRYPKNSAIMTSEEGQEQALAGRRGIELEGESDDEGLEEIMRRRLEALEFGEDVCTSGGAPLAGDARPAQQPEETEPKPPMVRAVGTSQPTAPRSSQTPTSLPVPHPRPASTASEEQPPKKVSRFKAARREGRDPLD